MPFQRLATIRLPTRWVSAMLLLGVLCWPALAHAQDPFFGQGMGGGLSPGMGSSGPGPSKKKGGNKPPPGTPETHAASGAEDSTAAPGSEPELP
ncbi:MAG TPA: hypothetical protein VL137_12390, partial [Polyangiaceae bacterium]|nr:hypothetical protein [Polyangiaceae bacterium]